MKELTRVFKALADTTRIRIVKMLQEKNLCVCELQEVLGIAQSSVSHHLKILEDAGLVEHEKCGQWVDYKIAAENDALPENTYAHTMLHHLNSWIENNPQILKDRVSMAIVDRANICRREIK